jgi:hypothetical protein
MRPRLCSALFAALCLVACDKPPVDWRDPLKIEKPPANSRLTVDTAGRVRYVADSSKIVTPPTGTGVCPSTFVAAAALTRDIGAWWNVRADSSAVLLTSSSTDGGKTWALPLAVDTTDVSSNGCRRPSPSLTTVGDDLYVAYSMIAPEGKGVFFAHTMGAMLHSPVPVIYGERLVATAIAADSVRVAVAYEEPNGTRRQVDVALSATEGHIFELHTTASRGIDNATAPDVAFAGPMLAVTWTTRPFEGGTPSRVVRVGRIR